MNILRMMLLGILFSLSASFTIIAVFNTDVVFTGEELLKQFTIALILGPVIGIGSLIFELDRLSFTLQLFFHFLYVTVSVIVAGWFGSWYAEDSFLSLGKLLFIEVIIYVFIWVILYIIAQQDIEKINQKLRRKREKTR